MHTSQRLVQIDGVFKWTSNTLGCILASFYYGYIFTPFLGSVLAMKFGGKMVMLVGQTWVALLTILAPSLTTVGDFPVLVTMRILEGFGQVVFRVYDGYFQALGTVFQREVQGQKSSFIMQHDTLIFAPPLEIVLIVIAA